MNTKSTVAPTLLSAIEYLIKSRKSRRHDPMSRIFIFGEPIDERSTAAGAFVIVFGFLIFFLHHTVGAEHRGQPGHRAMAAAYWSAMENAEDAATKHMQLAAAADFEAASYPKDVATLRDADSAEFLNSSMDAALQGGPAQSRGQGEAECMKDYADDGSGDQVCLPKLELSYMKALVQAKDAARLAIQEQASVEFARTGARPAGLEAAYTDQARAFQSAALPLLISRVTSGQLTADQAVKMFDVSLEPERLNSRPLQRMNATAISRMSRALPEPS